MEIVVETGDSFAVVTEGEMFSPPPMEQPKESRSPHWQKLAHDTVVAHPFCAASGLKHDLQVHHERPFHVHPELELDPSNLIVLNRTYHLIFGHLGDWKSWNADVRKDAARMYEQITKRPYN